MVAQKTAGPSRSDDIGIQSTDTNNEGYGFFANEPKASQCFETGRIRSFNVRKGSVGRTERVLKLRGHGRRPALHELFRGKPSGRRHVYLKSEPELEVSTMYHHNADCEFFQDLDLWCSAPAKEELAQTIDHIKPIEVNATNTDTFIPPNQPEWEALDAACPATPASLYTDKPLPLDRFIFPEADNKAHFQEKFLDISSLPVVIGNFTETWHSDTHTHIQPFIDQDDSLDAKLATVGPAELAWGRALRLDVPPAGPAHAALSTPEVLSFVEQLEKQNPPTTLLQPEWPTEETTYFDLESPMTSPTTSLAPPYEPVTPKSESDAESSSTRRRRRSDSSDDYTPSYEHKKPRKYRRRKAGLPIKDMIQALEDAQPVVRARRGRPPKRRASDSEPPARGDRPDKYREVRDKNNEASKRSRMNRKLKELQMEQQAIELEERNKKLKVRADILEDMTKRLKDALMSAILKP